MRHLLVGLTVALIAAVSPAAPGANPVFVPLGSHSGACTSDDSSATTVVIDYQSLGGGVQAYCANNLSGGATGLDALQSVASVQGTAHDGLSFVCRINSSPGPSQTITLSNGDAYTEDCVNTPPASAYWSYWKASQGGSWSYSSRGAASSSANIGGYEGWSFSVGGGIGSAPAPRMAPAAWVVIPPPAPPAPPPAPEPPSTSAPPPAPPPPPATSAQPKSTSAQPKSTSAQPKTTSAGAKSTSAGATNRPQSSAAEAAASTDPAQSTEAASVEPTPSSSSSHSPSPGLSSPTHPSPSPYPSSDDSEGVGPVGTIVGVGLILLLGVAAVIIWRRRSSGSVH